MNWQDTILTFANILLVYALIPQIYFGFRKKKKTINLQTSIVTTISLLSISIIYFSLNLYFAGITISIAFICWLMLLIQGIIYP